MVHWWSRCTSIFIGTEYALEFVKCWRFFVAFIFYLCFFFFFFSHSRKGRGWWRKLVDKLLWTIIKYQMHFLSLTYCSIFPLDKSIYTTAQKTFLCQTFFLWLLVHAERKYYQEKCSFVFGCCVTLGVQGCFIKTKNTVDWSYSIYV